MDFVGFQPGRPATRTSSAPRARASEARPPRRASSAPARAGETIAWRTRHMLPRITLLMLVACTTGGGLRPLPPVIPPPNDTQILPGRRAGVVGIGMTEAQLLQYAGNPQSSSMGEL